jgi:hypothetical protein
MKACDVRPGRTLLSDTETSPFLGVREAMLKLQRDSPFAVLWVGVFWRAFSSLTFAVVNLN